MSGGKGGSTETVTKLPDFIEKAAKENLAIADEVASIGFNPYMGPTVAGFSPQQMNAFQNVNQAAGAFGMNNVGLDPGMTNAQIGQALTGMAPPQQSVGGISGYSGVPLYQAALAQMPPAQRAMIESFFINPQTGASPANPAVPRPQFGTGPAPEPLAAPAPNWWEDQGDSGPDDGGRGGPGRGGGGGMGRGDGPTGGGR